VKKKIQLPPYPKTPLNFARRFKAETQMVEKLVGIEMQVTRFYYYQKMSFKRSKLILKL
jgi:hypothetical protein